MRRYITVLAVFALLAVLAAPAYAQPGRGGMGGIANLMTNKSVQDELKLTDEQKEKVKKLSDEAREKFGKDIRQAFMDMDREKAQKLQAEQTEFVLKALPDAIKADQLKRLKQIELQVQGVRAFTSEHVQKDLKLNDKQKEQIKTASEEASKTLGELRRELFGARDDKEKRDEIQKKIATTTKEATEKITSYLTDDQKKAWKDMTGEKFEVKFERPARPNP
jgi:Spy/CpxP family protein refolding chaperone